VTKSSQYYRLWFLALRLYNLDSCWPCSPESRKM